MGDHRLDPGGGLLVEVGLRLCSPDGAEATSGVFPHFAELVIGPRFARTRWLNAGYQCYMCSDRSVIVGCSPESGLSVSQL